MAVTLQFYKDQFLTQPVGATQLNFERAVGGGPVDQLLYLGSAQENRRFVADDGGQIVVSVYDADPSNASRFHASALRLALTQAGLDTATDGAPLQVGMQINSGMYAVVHVWVRFSGTSSTPMTGDNLSLVTNVVREYAV
ncbi:MAG: hypothetical protein ACP5GC_07140 [Thiomonas sp.]